jgi:hypothetical protein
MRKITTAITAVALALSMVAQAIPAAAIVGYDSSYAGETAFLNVSTGQTVNFQVFFANTGTTTWTRNTGTQVDLAACLEDKVSCNLQDAREAGWNSGWLSTVRYTTHTQTSLAPGAVGTFSYNVTAPVGAANGIYRFNGDLVLSSTGERLHPEGYFQEANLGGVTPGTGAATITDLDPDEGGTAGGDSVDITGSGIQCTPAFPSVSFGGTAAAVTSCGSTLVTVTSPAHAEGDVTVTLTNSGAAASNGLTFTYVDETDPTFTTMSVAGDLLTVTFSEPVCSDTGSIEADWTVRNIANPSVDLAAGATYGTNIPLCSSDDTSSTVTITLNATVPPGALVEAVLNESTAGAGENVRYEDAANNAANAPQARQATAAAPETTEPDLIGASGNVGSQTITLTFSEPIWCDTTFTIADVTVENLDGTDPSVTGFGSDPCTTTRASAETTFTVVISDDIEADSDYRVTITTPAEVQDAAQNELDDNTASFRGGAGDFTPPTIVDARIAANVDTTDFTETDDSFTMTFSEVMDTDTTGDTIQIQDQDGTVFTLSCGGALATTNSVSCDWNTSETTVTVTLDENITPPVVGAPGAGNTPGMQIPFNVTTLTGFADTQGNVPNVLGSSDRLVDFE